MGQRAWFQSSAILGASFFNSARTKRLFSDRLIVSDELLVLQWRSRIFVQKLILFNFYPFWHIFYHNNVAQKWVIRGSSWRESCVPLTKMLPRRFLRRIGLCWQTMRLIWLDFGWVPFYLRFYELRSIKTRKRTRQLSIHSSWPKIWQIKDLLHGQKGNCFSHRQQDSFHLDGS